MPRKGRIALLALQIILSAPLAAANEAVVRAPKVEAAFLRNFARYVGWPAHAFADERSPWRICILGPDPFGEILDETLRGREEQGRPFLVVRAASAAGLASCQVVYLASPSSDSRRAALAELASRPVLTVGDAPGFLQEGGIIRFQVSDHVEFAINLDRAHAASLKIPAKMLEVAAEIVDNGLVGRRR